MFDKASAFHFVLVRDNVARVVAEDAFQGIFQLERDGWTVVWDSARSEPDGYAYAARFHKSLSCDYSDGHKPLKMAGPRALFRSVSVMELVDIAERGSVAGRGNAFNEFDGRRFVFFGDRITPNLMNQGEEIERQAGTALATSPQSLEFNRLETDRRALATRFLGIFHVEAARMNAARAKEGYPPIVLDDRLLERVQTGSADAASRLRNMILPRKGELESICQSLHSHDVRTRVLREHYALQERDWIRAEHQRRESYPFTSAIVQTRPLSHGYHYSKAHGLSGMGDEDEYGFHPDSVSADDIDRIHLVRDSRIIRTEGGPMLSEIAEEFAESLRAPALDF